jgi:hypothetical protein
MESFRPLETQDPVSLRLDLRLLAWLRLVLPHLVSRRRKD